MIVKFVLSNRSLFQIIISSSVIRQNGESQNVRVRSGGKKCSLFGKFGVLCFLETPVLRFALLRYYRRVPVSEMGLWLVLFVSFREI